MTANTRNHTNTHPPHEDTQSTHTPLTHPKRMDVSLRVPTADVVKLLDDVIASTECLSLNLYPQERWRGWRGVGGGVG